VTPREAAEALEAAQHSKWRAEWHVHDVARWIMDQGEAFARQVSAELGDGGRIGKFRRWAELARAFPKESRSPEYSVQVHRRWLNKDKRAEAP
jgi:hypothetical protein